MVGPYGPNPSGPAAGAGSSPQPISGKPLDALGTSLMDKRITPRSPRAALEPEQVPLPQRSRKVRHPLVIAGNAVFTLLVLFGIVFGGLFAFGKSRFDAPGPSDRETIVNIPARSGMLDIAEILRREGVMDEHWSVFIGSVFMLKARSDLKSGEYQIPKRASVRDIVDILVEGKVVQHGLTIPEGLTAEQIVAKILESEFLAGSLRDIPREGTLLPDTYKFPRGTTREQVIQRMQQAQRRVLQEAWERRLPDLPIRSPEQLVTLASIIEKETGRADERTRVAAVFVNRLKQKMRLQSDPTIIYGIVGGKATLGRPISRADIEQPTAYNTYVIDGLPPGPIANPGRLSLEAAANPARTKELYFVADGTGGHAFADTYEVHQRNVARLRVIEAQSSNAGAAQPAATTATDDSQADTATTTPARNGRRTTRTNGK